MVEPIVELLETTMFDICFYEMLPYIFEFPFFFVLLFLTAYLGFFFRRETSYNIVRVVYVL